MTEAVLRLRGRAIPEFLQGQLTCDTRKVTPETAVAGAFCSPKGRVITDLVVIQLDEDQCLLRLSADLSTDVATALGRYAQFSRIGVAVDEQTKVFGLLAPARRGDNARGDAGLPGAVATVDGGIVLKRTDSADEYISLEGDLPGGFDGGDGEVSEALWQGEILRSGHFRVTRKETGAFTPQALNYDETGRVAFDKGCYTGQEVVARLHYKGQSKKRIRVYTGSRALLETGLVELLDEAGANAGKILRALPTRDGNAAFACEVPLAHFDQQLRVDGSDATLQPLATS
ncbi:MAG: folate-binding protein [Pseudomonadota bacterium]